MAPTGSGDASDVHPAPTAAEVKEEEAPQSLPNAAGDAPDPAAEGDTVGNPQDEVAHMTVPDAEEAGPIARPDGEVAAQPEGDIAAHPQGDIAAEHVAASEEVENVAPMDPAAAAAAQAVQAALAHTAAAAGAQHHAEQVAAEQQVVYSDPSAVPTHFTPPTLPEPVMAPMAPVAAPATDGRGRKSSERYHASMEQLRHLEIGRAHV